MVGFGSSAKILNQAGPITVSQVGFCIWALIGVALISTVPPARLEAFLNSTQVMADTSPESVRPVASDFTPMRPPCSPHPPPILT